MKKLIRWAICLGLCLALVVCGAMAAESGIKVQLDGQDLTFTDAVPQVKDQRTFLPSGRYSKPWARRWTMRGTPLPPCGVTKRLS